MASESELVTVVLNRLDATDANLHRALSEMQTSLTLRLSEQDRELREIRVQTTRTNGRVTTLEKAVTVLEKAVALLENARVRAQGVMAGYRWVPPTLLTLLGTGLTILVLALTGSLH